LAAHDIDPERAEHKIWTDQARPGESKSERERLEEAIEQEQEAHEAQQPGSSP
jgi:hypothetical protein